MKGTLERLMKPATILSVKGQRVVMCKAAVPVHGATVYCTFCFDLNKGQARMVLPVSGRNINFTAVDKMLCKKLLRSVEEERNYRLHHKLSDFTKEELK